MQNASPHDKVKEMRAAYIDALNEAEKDEQSNKTMEDLLNQIWAGKAASPELYQNVQQTVSFTTTALQKQRVMLTEAIERNSEFRKRLEKFLSSETQA